MLNNKNMFGNVRAFHEKFDVDMPDKPQLLEAAVAEFRLNFFKEEVGEFAEAVENDDIIEMFDACIDLVYIALGTAQKMGISEEQWYGAWQIVQNANMSKVSGKEAMANGIKTKKPPRHESDVLKPLDWVTPDISTVL